MMYSKNALRASHHVYGSGNLVFVSQGACSAGMRGMWLARSNQVTEVRHTTIQP